MQKTPSINHSSYLNIIKRVLKADFVGWVTEKEKKSLRVKIGKKEFSLPLEGDNINHETYSHLINNLIKTEE